MPSAPVVGTQCRCHPFPSMSGTGRTMAEYPGVKREVGPVWPGPAQYHCHSPAGVTPALGISDSTRPRSMESLASAAAAVAALRAAEPYSIKHKEAKDSKGYICNRRTLQVAQTAGRWEGKQSKDGRDRGNEREEGSAKRRRKERGEEGAAAHTA